jgi:hypothetical protein
VEVSKTSEAADSVIGVQIPSNAVGLTAIANRGDLAIGIKTIRSPNNANIVDNYVLGPNSYSWDGGRTVVSAAPLSDHPDAMPFLSGQWQVEVTGGTQIQASDVSIWYRQTVDGGFHGGAIDVNFLLVPGAGTETYLNQLASNAFNGWSGLSLGTVTFYPMDAKFSVIDQSNYYEVIEETKVAVNKPALNVIVLDSINFESMPLGFSTGLPGNPLQHGTAMSAVVVTLTGQFQVDRVTLRHEAGHFAGLFHTTEIAGGSDFLSDTPVCMSVDQLFDQCPDFSNLMFPYANPQSSLAQSPKQTTVVRASALYRAAVEKGGGFAKPLSVQPPPGSGLQPWRQDPQAEARAVQRERVAAQATGAWRAHVSDQAADILGGLWCGVRPSLVVPAGVKNLSAEALLRVAEQSDAPAHVRMRAAWSLREFKLAASERVRLEKLARQTGPARLRVAAYKTLKRSFPARAKSLHRLLSRDANPVVVRSIKP